MTRKIARNSAGEGRNADTSRPAVS